MLGIYAGIDGRVFYHLLHGDVTPAGFPGVSVDVFRDELVFVIFTRWSNMFMVMFNF